MFFSHGAGNAAGVGILVAKTCSQKFDTIGEEEAEHLLEDIWPRRVARLTLAGKEGNLRIFVIYFTTWDVADERSCRDNSLLGTSLLQERPGSS